MRLLVVAVPSAVLALSLGGSTVACHRSTAPESTPVAAIPESDEDPLKATPAHDAGVIPICTSDPPHWLVPLREGAAELAPTYEAATAYPVATGAWTAWIDHGTASLVVQPPTGEVAHTPLGPGEVQPPEIAAFGDDLIVVLPIQRPTGRVHRVLRVHGATISDLFTQPEALDDEFDVAVVPTSQGALIAWNDAIPNGPSIVTGQFVPNALLHGGPIPPPAPHPLTEPDQDANDPVFVSRADGSVTMAWLASHEIEDVIANATTADVFVRAIGPNGLPLGPPVQISPGPGNRFGVQIAAAGATTWITYRVAGDADQESQGDGGSIAVIRLGADLHPSASPTYVTERESNPSGPAAIFADGTGASVFWTEREGDAVRTLRRAVESDGRVLRAASIETALHGEVPVGGDAARPWALMHGNRGEPGLIRLRCPPAPMPFVPSPIGNHT